MAYDTDLTAVMDITAPYNMAAYRLLIPSFIDRLAYSIPLGLRTIFYPGGSPLVVIALLVILAERNTAALGL